LAPAALALAALALAVFGAFECVQIICIIRSIQTLVSSLKCTEYD